MRRCHGRAVRPKVRRAVELPSTRSGRGEAPRSGGAEDPARCQPEAPRLPSRGILLLRRLAPPPLRMTIRPGAFHVGSTADRPLSANLGLRRAIPSQWPLFRCANPFSGKRRAFRASCLHKAWSHVLRHRSFGAPGSLLPRPKRTHIEKHWNAGLPLLAVAGMPAAGVLCQGQFSGAAGLHAKGCGLKAAGGQKIRRAFSGARCRWSAPLLAFTPSVHACVRSGAVVSLHVGRGGSILLQQAKAARLPRNDDAVPPARRQPSASPYTREGEEPCATSIA